MPLPWQCPQTQTPKARGRGWTMTSPSTHASTLAVSLSAMTFRRAPPMNGSQLISFTHPSMVTMAQRLLCGNNGTPGNIFQNLCHSNQLPGIRVLPPFPDQFGCSGLTMALSSQASASASTSTADSLNPKADSSTSLCATQA